MNQSNAEILRMLGLTSIESKVYLTLIEYGSSLAGSISDKSHIHRRNVYDALDSLLQKGLATYVISNNRKVWSPISPEKIKSIVKEKEIAVIGMLPELMKKYGTSKSKQTVEVFEGLGGMKSFYDDILASKKELIVLFATGKPYQRMPFYMKKWDETFAKNKVKRKILLNHGYSIEENKIAKYRQIKVLPKELSSPTQIFIYGEKSAVAIWSEEPIATLISNKEVSDGFRKYFDFLWSLGNSIDCK
jgi:sugar-specific transcriptional regulator TrmB